MSEWCGWPVVDESAGWEAAQQILADAELSDGLPLVPPTRRRLEAMVAGITNRSESKGMMPPMFGDLTPDSVAYQCVIAGAQQAVPHVLARFSQGLTSFAPRIVQRFLDVPVGVLQRLLRLALDILELAPHFLASLTQFIPRFVDVGTAAAHGPSR